MDIVCLRKIIWLLGARPSLLKSSFFKMSSVPTKTKIWHFQIPPVWKRKTSLKSEWSCHQLWQFSSVSKSQLNVIILFSRLTHDYQLCNWSLHCYLSISKHPWYNLISLPLVKAADYLCFGSVKLQGEFLKLQVVPSSSVLDDCDCNV